MTAIFGGDRIWGWWERFNRPGLAAITNLLINKSVAAYLWRSIDQDKTRYEVSYFREQWQYVLAKDAEIRRATKTYWKAAATGSAHDIKENDSLDDVGSTTSLTLCRDWKPEITKCVERIAAICSLYNIDLWNLAEKYDLDVYKNVVGCLTSFCPTLLTTSSGIKWWSRQPWHVWMEWNQTRDQFIGRSNKPESEWSFVLLRCSHPAWYEVSNLDEREARTDTTEDSGASDAESERNVGVEPRAVFEVKSSALRYISAVEHYQQTTGERCTANTFVIEMVIYFWQSGALWGELLGHTDYGGYGSTATIYPLCTTVLKSISRVPS